MLERKGADVKRLYLMDIPRHEFRLSALIQWLPNLKKISMVQVGDTFESFGPNENLNLPKLKELIVKNCTFSVPGVLDNLPTGVLRKLNVTYQIAGEYPLGSLFNNQMNLEVLEILVLTLNADANTNPDFRSLSQLRKLQSLSFSCEKIELVEGFLNEIRSSSVKTLSIGSVLKPAPVLTVLSLELLGRNFPQLKHLHFFSNSSINFINAIVEHCKTLKILNFTLSPSSSDEYIFQPGLNNETLTTLTIKADVKGMSAGIPRLLNACKKLIEFTSTMRADTESVQAMLTLQPNLNVLLLSHARLSLSAEFVQALKIYGQNLNNFSCKYRVLSNVISEEYIKHQFGSLFKYITFVKLGFYADPDCRWTMRKY